MPQAYVDLWNEALIKLEEEGTKEDLRQLWVQPPGGCPTKSSSNLANAQINMEKVAGLWIFLAAAMGLGFLINFAVWAWKRWVQGLEPPRAVAPDFCWARGQTNKEDWA